MVLQARLPGDGVGGEQVGKELGYIAQLIGLQAVDERILLHEAFFKQTLPRRVMTAEALRQQAVVPVNIWVCEAALSKIQVSQ